MLESSIVSESSSGIGAGKVLDKKAHFKAGAIDFTAGSLGIEWLNFYLKIVSFFTQNVCNSAGGVALVYVSQPLDTVKVKMQAFPTIYKGMVDCLTQTFKKDGIVRGLYAGTLPSIAANVAENSVLFVGMVSVAADLFLAITWQFCQFNSRFFIRTILGYGACQKFIANIEGHKSVDELSSLR